MTHTLSPSPSSDAAPLPPQGGSSFSLSLGRSLARAWLDSDKASFDLWGEKEVAPPAGPGPNAGAAGEVPAAAGPAPAKTLDRILADLGATEPVASLLTPEEIAADIARDVDPWAESLNGARAGPLPDEAMSSLIALLGFARCLKGPEDLAGLFAPAALTLVFAPDAATAKVMESALCHAVLERLALAAGQGLAASPLPKILAPGSNSTGSEAARVTDWRSRTDKHLRAGLPVIGVVMSPLAPGRVLTALADRTLHLPRLDAALLLEALRMSHSATGQIAKAEVLRRLPAPEALRRLDATAVEVAARAPTTLSVATRLAKFAGRLAPVGSVTLADLHGQPALRSELDRMCRDLDLWREGRLVWSQCVASAVFHGPPGNGKTLCAQALAGSAGVPLVTTSYAECQRHGHQGDMLAALARAFDDAIGMAPSVLFIDELDSFAARGGGSSSARYLNGVVNGLLEQLNRVVAAEGVIVLGATNHLSTVDPAVIRGGRFDLKLLVAAPDRAGLAAILQAHLRRLVPGNSIAAAEIEALAGRLVGASGADAAALVRAAVTAARDAGHALGFDDLTRAAEAFAPVADSADERRVALHEAGHILVGLLSGLPAPLAARLTRDGGEVEYPVMRVLTRPEVLACLRRDLAGRAAEAVMLGCVSSGSGVSAGSDLARATDLAWRMEVQYGFGDGGLTWQPVPGAGTLPPPPWLVVKIDHLLKTAEEEARALICRHRTHLTRIAEALLVRRELTAGDIRELTRDLTPNECGPMAGQEGNVIPFPV
jgi:hypothetical protein